MADAHCTPDRHLGEDLEGRCSLCGDRLERPSPLLTLLVFVAVVLTGVLAAWAFLGW